jgi:starch synthase
MKSLNILFAASEVAPFIKTGGLADVAGSLPKALERAGADVRVILPLYGAIGAHFRGQMTFLFHFNVTFAWRSVYCGLFSLEKDGVTYYFVDNEHYFNRSEPYGHYDDGERFGYFSRAVVECIPKLDWVPNVVHCNDWQTALIPVYLKEDADRIPMLSSIRTVFTIHNVEYQGRYGRETLEGLFGLPAHWYENGAMEYYDDISLMKGAICAADFITTVSPTYAQELHHSFYAHGMEGILSANAHKMQGILNGIDTDVYNPATDPALFQTYTADDLSGKRRDKQELQRTLGLNLEPDIPIIACISRLVPHKGMDLVTAVLPQIMELPVQFVVLGRGDWRFEQAFLNARQQYPSRLSANIMYSSGLAMNIYAGADLFLMPSKSEPCGLSQMIAMRYGTLPIVRETGGLKDTVSPYNQYTGEGNGFTFSAYNAHDMLHVIREAVSLYQNREIWHTLMQRDMNADFSWNKSAKGYLDIYSRLVP